MLAEEGRLVSAAVSAAVIRRLLCPGLRFVEIKSEVPATTPRNF